MANFIFYRKLIICFALLSLSLSSKAQTYCTSSFFSSGCAAFSDYIQSFSTTGGLTNITNNSTGCGSGSYTYYSSMSVTAVQGTSFSFSITNTSASGNEWFNIWVDWNNDGDFTDANETAYTSSSTSAGAVLTGSIAVPSGANVATTRLRVMVNYSANGSPCAGLTWGEVEDYNMVVQAACQTPLNVTINNLASSSADFTWDPVSSILGYEYVIDQIATSPTGSGTFITTNSYSAAGLSSSTAYYFHVRTQCGAGAFSLWANVPFTTTFNPCPFPTGITFTPTGTSIADFNWTAIAGTGGYEYTVNSSGSTPLTSGTSTLATTANVSGLIGGNTYYFFLRNACTAPSGTSDWTRFQFMMPECYKPSGILVTTVSDTAADFIWGITSNANYYEYQVDPNYTPPVSSSGFSSTTGMSAHVEGLIPQTRYYVHLRSRCFAADTSEWILDSLVTQMGCLRPDVRVTGAQTNNVSAMWDAVPNAIAYEYRVDNTTASPAFGTETTNTFTGPITLPSNGKDYYLHVRAKCNSQFSFSQWVTKPLRTGALDVFNISAQDFDVNVYPNPVKDDLQIRIMGQLHDGATIILTDITGKLVLQKSVIQHVEEIDLNGLSQGIYMLKYQDDFNIKVIKITKE
jgi:hypothetical protein